MSEHDMQNTNPPLPPMPPEITQLLCRGCPATLGQSRKRGIRRAARASDGIAWRQNLFRNRPFRLANRQCEIRCRQSGGQPESRRHPSQARRTERLQGENIVGERRLLLVTSTQGEGEPPEEAVVLHKLLNGKSPEIGQTPICRTGFGRQLLSEFLPGGQRFRQTF